MIEWACMSKTLDAKYASFTYRMLQDELTHGNYEGNMSPALHATRRFEYPWVYDRLDLQPNDSILDVACGVTFFPVQLAKESDVIVCVDIDPEVVIGMFDMSQNIASILGDAQQLEYDDNYFDKSYCISALEHMSDSKKVIDEMLRVTKDKVLITADIVLEGEGELTYEQFIKLMKEYNMDVPQIPYDVILTRNQDTLFAVACVEMER